MTKKNRQYTIEEKEMLINRMLEDLRTLYHLEKSLW